jgi:hypothetical protein
MQYNAPTAPTTDNNTGTNTSQISIIGATILLISSTEITLNNLNIIFFSFFFLKFLISLCARHR